MRGPNLVGRSREGFQRRLSTSWVFSASRRGSQTDEKNSGQEEHLETLALCECRADEEAEAGESQRHPTLEGPGNLPWGVYRALKKYPRICPDSAHRFADITRTLAWEWGPGSFPFQVPIPDSTLVHSNLTFGPSWIFQPWAVEHRPVDVRDVDWFFVGHPLLLGGGQGLQGLLLCESWGRAREDLSSVAQEGLVRCLGF